MRTRRKLLFAVLLLILMPVSVTVFMSATNVSGPHSHKLYCNITDKSHNQNIEFLSYKITTKYGFPRYGKGDAEIGIIKYKLKVEGNIREKILAKYGGAHDLQRIFPILCKKVIIDKNIILVRMENNNRLILSDDLGLNFHVIEVQNDLPPLLQDLEGNKKNGMYTIIDYWYTNKILFIKQASYLSETMRTFKTNDFDDYNIGKVLKCDKCKAVLWRVISSKDYGRNWEVEKYGVNKSMFAEDKHILMHGNLSRK